MPIQLEGYLSPPGAGQYQLGGVQGGKGVLELEGQNKGGPKSEVQKSHNKIGKPTNSDKIVNNQDESECKISEGEIKVMTEIRAEKKENGDTSVKDKDGCLGLDKNNRMSDVGEMRDEEDLMLMKEMDRMLQYEKAIQKTVEWKSENEKKIARNEDERKMRIKVVGEMRRE